MSAFVDVKETLFVIVSASEDVFFLLSVLLKQPASNTTANKHVKIFFI